MGVALLSLSVHAPALAQTKTEAQTQVRSYLDWPGKRAAQAATPPAAPETAPATPLQRALPNAATGQPGFDIPPSPYGQVGNPYRHELNWRGKTAPVSAQAAAPQTPPQTAPKTELASNWTPVPQSRFDTPRRAAPEPVTPPVQPAPQKIEATPLATPQARVANPVPLPQPKPPVVSAETVARETAPVAAVKPAPVPPVAPPPVQAQAAAPVSAPIQPQVQPQPRPDGGYRLPANSKYAGRVSPELEGRPAVPAQAAAPVAQKPEAPKAQAQTAPQTTAEAKPTPTTKTPAAKASAPKAGAKTAEAKPADVKTATAPAATAPLAQAAEQESAEPYTPFVPGSRATTASQAPRFYSLHRAYGYEPDPAPHTGGDLALDPGAVQTPAADKASEKPGSAATSKAQKTDPTPAKDKTL